MLQNTSHRRNSKKYRQLISSFVNQYSGRVVDSPGDNILAEFSSVVDAVEYAVKIQENLQEKNAKLPENRRMEFRIGVNLGDVIDDEGRIGFHNFLGLSNHSSYRAFQRGNNQLIPILPQITGRKVTLNDGGFVF